jgi:transcriptional regulator with XRE-family HTH domain
MPNPDLIKLGTNIRRIRTTKRISQEQLAAYTELHRTYIGGIERGERNVSFLNLLKIAQALNTSLDEIVKGI